MAEADAIIQGVFEALGKDADRGNTADALRVLYEAGEWNGEEIVATIRRELDEARND